MHYRNTAQSRAEKAVSRDHNSSDSLMSFFGWSGLEKVSLNCGSCMLWEHEKCGFWWDVLQQLTTFFKAPVTGSSKLSRKESPEEIPRDHKFVTIQAMWKLVLTTAWAVSAVKSSLLASGTRGLRETLQNRVVLSQVVELSSRDLACLGLEAVLTVWHDH